MVVVYPVIFTKTNDENDTYLVDIPDIDGISEGYGITDAINMARDFIGCYFLSETKNVPTPSDIKDIDITKSKFYGEGTSFISLVDMDVDAYRKKMNNKSVRRNVSIPEWLNVAADEAHLNVSRILQDALKEKLEITNV